MGRTSPSIGGEGEGEKTTYGRSSKKPTVGRLTNLPWVAKTTYRRSLLGSFREANLGDLERPPSPLKESGLGSLTPSPQKPWGREGCYTICKKRATPYIIGSPLTLSQTKGQGEGASSLTEALQTNYKARM